MSFLGGIARSLINPATLVQLAMGPAGWASLAVRTLGAQIAMNVIQQLGDKLGLPQSVTDLAQASFAQSAGMPGLARQNLREAVSGLGDQFNLSPSAEGQLLRAAEADTRSLFDQLSEAFASGKELAEARRSTRGKGSWLQAIADSMAKALDAKVQDMDRMSKDLDKQGKNRSVKTSTDLQVAGQEFSYLMNTTSTVIKTIGEGLSSMARKQ